MPTPPIPAGFTRHPVSGCIIPTAEVEAHERAMSARAARRAGAENVSPAAQLDAAMELARAQAKELADLRAQLATKATPPTPVES